MPVSTDRDADRDGPFEGGDLHGTNSCSRGTRNRQRSLPPPVRRPAGPERARATVLTSPQRRNTPPCGTHPAMAHPRSRNSARAVASASAVRDPELAEGRKIARARQVHVIREEALPEGRRLYIFKANETSGEAVVDADGAFKKAKCTCSFFYKNSLRAGPCRHLLDRASAAARLRGGASAPGVPVEPRAGLAAIRRRPATRRRSASRSLAASR